MEYPDDLYYSREHIWVRIKGSQGTLGVTNFAQHEMGEVLFADLAEEGTQVEKDEVFGSLESSKAVSELRAPVSGEIVSINKDLDEEPAIVNDDPYGKGWLVVIEMDDPNELEELLNSADYEEYLEQKDGGEEE